MQPYGLFFKRFLHRPSQVAAVAPSSRVLARRMVEWIDWETVDTVVEYGPGTGSFSRAIVECIKPGTTYFALELDDGMLEHMATAHPDVTVYHDSAANVRKYLAQHGKSQVDVIISGLPWAAFDAALQHELISATLDVLPAGGRFATFAYLQGLPLPHARRFKRSLDAGFARVDYSPIAWWNLPPALVYRCTR